MPESVFLDFTPPDRADLVKLLIYEGSSPTGPFSIIETVTLIGDYPDYISSYTTAVAASKLNYFTIQWEDSKGARTEMSNAVQGGKITLVGDLVERVQVRDSSLDEQVILQEAEAIVEIYFKVDPYTVPNEAVSYAVKNALTKLIQAKTMFSEMMSSSGGGSATGWTAGLVSMKSDTSGGQREIIEFLMNEAAAELGFGISVVAQMVGIEIAGGMSQIVSADISRLLIEVE